MPFITTSKPGPKARVELDGELIPPGVLGGMAQITYPDEKGSWTLTMHSYFIKHRAIQRKFSR